MIHSSEQRTSVDFNQIPFTQSVFECLPQHPTEGSGDSGPIQIGRFYYNTTDNNIYVFTPNGWISVKFAQKKVFVIGNGTDKIYTCKHDLGSRDITITVRLSAEPYSIVDIDTAMTDLNTVTISSDIPLLNNELTVIIQ